MFLLLGLSFAVGVFVAPPSNLPVDADFPPSLKGLWSDEAMHGENLGASPEMLRKRQSMPRQVDWTSFGNELGGPISKVRFQGTASTCWMHAALSAAEANHNLMKLKLNAGAVTDPFYIDFDNALHCMQLRLEQSGATPARLQHPADLVATVKCTGRLPALGSVVNEGQCQSFKNSPAFDAFVNKWNEFGDQYGLWPSAVVLDEPANRWTISVMAYLQDWRQVPGWETADGRFAAVFNHFKQAMLAGFGRAGTGQCTLEELLPFTPLVQPNYEIRPHDWLAEQQRCSRQSADGDVEGECYTRDGVAQAFLPTNAADFTGTNSTVAFDSAKCVLVGTDEPGATTEQFSRYWSLAATWDRTQKLPRDDGFVSQRPYWLAFSPTDVYETQDSAKIQQALLSMMATLDHGVAHAVMQTCEPFIQFADTELGEPIWFPECDSMTPQPPAGNPCAAPVGGFHAVVVVGYHFVGFDRPLEESYFVIQNSWSEGWGVGGFARLAMGHFLLSRVTLPLLRDPLSLRNPLLPKINPLVAYQLPPTLFVSSASGEAVRSKAIGTANVAQFPLDGSEFVLDVTQKLPDVAVSSITLTLAAPAPADLDAVLGIQFSQTNPANRAKSSGVIVSRFARGLSTTKFGGVPAPTITFTLPAEASDVPASSWFVALVLSVKSATSTGTVDVWRINYAVDNAKSAAFLSDGALSTDPSTAAATVAVSGAALAASAAVLFA
jgi:hypothetical protein